MRRLDVFFDFTCPYCREGLRLLPQVLASNTDVTVRWYPCEAHPRPEQVVVHSDMALRMYYVLREQSEKTNTYEEDLSVRSAQTDECFYRFIWAVFEAHFADGKRIDDVNVLAQLASDCGFDGKRAALRLREGAYAKQPDMNNQLVWGELAMEAVPSYRYEDHILSSQSGAVADNDAILRLLREAVGDGAED